MKISAKGSSKYLTRADLATPITATIADVRQQRLKGIRGEENQLILSFAGSVNPMVLRPANRKILIAAYGDETDHWRGKPVEIYLDPDVEMGGEIVGGVRVRVPAASRITNGSMPQAASPAPQLTTTDRHAQLLDGYTRSTTVENLEKWRAWAAAIPFLAQQIREQEATYNARKTAIEAAAPAGRPVGNAGAR